VQWKRHFEREATWEKKKIWDKHIQNSSGTQTRNFGMKFW
jgi:hypothetical protein